MITAGVSALAELAPALDDPDASLLPSLEDLRIVSVNIATAVANAARKEGISNVQRDEDWTEEEVRERQWDPGEWLLLSFALMLCTAMLMMLLPGLVTCSLPSFRIRGVETPSFLF